MGGYTSVGSSQQQDQIPDMVHRPLLRPPPPGSTWLQKSASAVSEVVAVDCARSAALGQSSGARALDHLVLGHDSQALFDLQGVAAHGDGDKFGAAFDGQTWQGGGGMQATCSEPSGELACLHNFVQGLQVQYDDMQAQLHIVAETLQAQIGEALAERQLEAVQEGEQSDLSEALAEERRCRQQRLHALADELKSALQSALRLGLCKSMDSPKGHSELQMVRDTSHEAAPMSARKSLGSNDDILVLAS